MNQTIFLGGTCGKNNWRDGLIDRLVARGIPQESLFNPVVLDWNEEAQKREDDLKADPNVKMLYYFSHTQNEVDKLRSTEESGNYFLSFYSLFEAVTGLYDAPFRTIIVIDQTDIVPRAAKRLLKVANDLRRRFPGAPIFDSLSEAEDWLVADLIKR